MNTHINRKKLLPQKHFLPKIVSRRLQMTGNDFAKAAYMADIFDLANCASPDSTFNTGIPLCDLAKGKIKGVMFADRGVVFTPSDAASPVALIAAIITKTHAARGGRVYPVWDLNNFEDNTGDPTTGPIGNLTTATIVVSDAVPAFRFGYNGTEKRHTNMALMGGSQLDVFFLDDKFALYGCASGVNMKGYSVLQSYVDTGKFIVTEATNQYAFRTTLGSINEVRDSSRYVVLNTGVLAAVGLINIDMKLSSSAANVHEFLLISDGGTDIGPLYGTIIDGLTFTARNLETGAVFTVTSVAYAAGTLGVTLDSTAWTALNTGDRVQINGPTAAAMKAAGVTPFEFKPVIVIK